MAQKITYEIGFQYKDASLQKVKTELQAIKDMTTLDFKAQNPQLNTQQAFQELKVLHAAAEDLDQAFTKAFNPNLKTFNIATLNQELKKLDINKIYTSFQKAGDVGQSAFRNVATAAITTNTQLKTTNKLLDKMAVTMANTVRFGIASSVWNNLTGALEKAWSYTKGLDKSLNNIRIVTGKTSANMEAFATAANRAAKELGTSTRDYADAALIYYQQGLDQAEVLERTNITIKMANVTGESAQQVSDYMTAVWNNFKEGSHTLEYYADVMAALGAATASSTDEIAGGLEKFAAVAETVGLSFEYATAALATITAETRQSEDVVGTALKTIFARIQDLELGETLEDGTTLGTYSEALAKVGINIKQQNGELKDMDDILKEMGMKWNTISKDQQIALAQAVAGVRQYNQLIALMSRWDTFEINLDTAINAEGMIDEQQATYMQSTAAGMESLGAATERLIDSFTDADQINGLTDALTTAVVGIANFVEALGGGGNTLLMLGGIATQVFDEQIAKGLSDVILNLKRTQDEVNKTSAEFENMKIFGDGKDSLVNDSVLQAAFEVKKKLNSVKGVLSTEDYDEFNQQIVNLTKYGTETLKENVNSYKNAINNIILSSGPHKDMVIEAFKTKMTEQERQTWEELTTNLNSSDASYDAFANEIVPKIQDFLNNSGYDDVISYVEQVIEEFKIMTSKTSQTAQDLKSELGIVLDNFIKKNIKGDKIVTDNTKIAEAGRENAAALAATFEAYYATAQEMLSKNEQKAIETVIAKIRNDSYFVGVEGPGKAGEIKYQFDKEFYDVIKILEKYETKTHSKLDNYLQLFKDFSTGVKNNLDPEEAKKIVDEVAKTISENLDPAVTAKNTKAVIDLSSGVAQLVSGFQALTNIPSILNNRDLTTAEKLFQIVSAFVTSLPILINSIKLIRKSLADINPILIKLGNGILKASKNLIDFSRSMKKVSKEDFFEKLNKNIDTFKQNLASLKDAILIVFNYLMGNPAAVKQAKDWNTAEKALSNYNDELKEKIMLETLNKQVSGNGSSVVSKNTQSILSKTGAKDGLKDNFESLSKMKDAGNTGANISPATSTLATPALTGATGAGATGATSAVSAAGSSSAAAATGATVSSGAAVASPAVSSAAGAAAPLAGLGPALVAIVAIIVVIAAVLAVAAVAINEYEKHLYRAADAANAAAKEQQELTDKAREETTAMRELNSSVQDLTNSWKKGEISGRAYREEIGKLAQEFGDAALYAESLITEAEDLQGLFDKTQLEQEKALIESENELQEDLSSAIKANLEVEVKTNQSYKHRMDDFGDTIDLHGLVWKNKDEKAMVEALEELGIQFKNWDHITIESLADVASTNYKELEKVLQKYSSQEAAQQLLTYLGSENIAGHLESMDASLQGEKEARANEIVLEKTLYGIKQSTGDTNTDTIINAVENEDKIAHAFEQKEGKNVSGITYDTLGEYYELQSNHLTDEEKNYQTAIENFAKTFENSDEVLEDLYSSKDQNDFELKVAKYRAEKGGMKEVNDLKTYSQAVSNAANEAYEEGLYDTEDEARKAMSIKMSAKMPGLGGAYSTYTALAEKISGGSYSRSMDFSAMGQSLLDLDTAELAGLYENAEQIDWKSLAGKSNEEIKKQVDAWALQYKDVELELEQAITNRTSEFEALDLDADEIKEYGEYLTELAGTEDGAAAGLSENLEKDGEAAALVSKAVTRLNRGLESLGEGWEEWGDILKKSDKSSKEYFDALSETQDALGDVLDLNEDAMEYMDGEFVADNLDLIGKAAEGNEEAVDQLREKLSQKMVVDIAVENGFTQESANQFIGRVQSLQDQLDGMKLGASISLDTEGLAQSESELLTACNKIIQDAEMTADQANAFFNSMGFTPVYETTIKPVQQTVPVYEESKVAIEWDENGDPIKWRKTSHQNGVETFTGEMEVPAMKTSPDGTETPIIKEIKKTGVPGGMSNYSRKNSGGKSLGGKGSGSKKKKQDPQKDELNRYQKVDSQLDKISNKLDKLQSQRDKFTGQKLFNNLYSQFDTLNNKIDVTRDKLAIANEEMNEYKQELAKDYGIKFGADGVIQNYKEQYYKELDRYNAAIDKYSASDKESDQEKLKEAEERYNNYTDLIEKYDELIGSFIPDLEKDIQDAIDEQIAIKIEAFKYELDLKLNIKDAKIEWNEFKKTVLDGIEDTDILGNTKAKLADVKVYFDDMGEGLLQTNTEKINSLLTDLKNMDKELDGKIYKDDRASAMEDLKEYYTTLMDNLTEIHELSEEIHDSYMEMMDEAQEKFDEQIEAYSTINDLIEHDKNVITMIYGEESYSALSQFYDRQEENNNKQLDFQKQQVEFWANQMALTEEGSEEWDKAKENWMSAVSEWNSTVEAAIQNLQDKYLNAINEIFQKLNNEVTNGLGLDYVETQWDLVNRNAEEYLDSVNAIYNVQQLQSKYLDAIEQHDSTIQQKKLNDLMEQEIGYLREQDKLSQYDIDRANLKYEIALKQIALEEAQQNKTQLRLRRDSQGNYTYQYTQDDDQVSSIQQEIADLYNQLYNLDAEEYRGNLEGLYDVWVEFQEKMAEAAQINDPEQRAAKELLIKEQYGELINTLAEKNELIQSNLNQSTMSHLFDLYNQNIENYDMMTAEQQAILSQFMTEETDFTNAAFDNLFGLYNTTVENFQGMSNAQRDILMGSIVPQWETAVQAMADKIIGEGGFFPVCSEAFIKLDETTQEYETGLATLQEVAGQSAEAIKNGLDPVIEKTQQLVKDNDELIETYNKELEAVQSVIDELDTLRQAYVDAESAAKTATEAAKNYWIAATNKDANADASKVLDAEFGTEADVTKDLAKTDTNNNTSAEPTKPTLEIGSFVDVKSGALWYSNSYGGGKSGRAKDGKIKYINSKGSHPYNIGGLGWIKKSDIVGYDTGGYTGDWGSDGRLAMLHQKELVLNASDTKNMLNAIEIVRDITSNLGATLMSRMAGISAANTYGGDSGVLEQNVHITAEFPNVENSHEIEDALNNLINKASQYIQK